MVMVGLVVGLTGVMLGAVVLCDVVNCGVM